MNERIKQLYEQAMEQHVSNNMAWAELNPEKFAKLIVQECIDILPEKVQIDDLYDARILVQCGMAIKTHFGVPDAPVNVVDRILQTVRTRGQK